MPGNNEPYFNSNQRKINLRHNQHISLISII